MPLNVFKVLGAVDKTAKKYKEAASDGEITCDEAAELVKTVIDEAVGALGIGDRVIVKLKVKDEKPGD